MRKTQTYTVPATGKRDAGKKFIITEMPAVRAERWAAKALLVLAHSQVELPDDWQRGGMASLAVVGFRALQNIKYDEVEPLMDEMMTCVTFEPSPGINRPLVNNSAEGDDIEEIETIIELRKQIFALHTDFF